MNFPKRLELLLWAVFAFPNAWRVGREEDVVVRQKQMTHTGRRHVLNADHAQGRARRSRLCSRHGLWVKHTEALASFQTLSLKQCPSLDGAVKAPPPRRTVPNGVGARQINNGFKIYLSQSWINCQSEHEVAEASRPDGAKQKKISSESNGIHVAVWNMCSGWALIRRSSTSPRRSVYVVWLPGGEVVFWGFFFASI